MTPETPETPKSAASAASATFAADRESGEARAFRGRVTKTRVMNSEWIKLRTLRSTPATAAATLAVMVGLSIPACRGQADGYAGLTTAQRLAWDPAGWSQLGFTFAQLSVGMLGVLTFSGEYSTGMIRATLGAVPRRLPVLWAKALVFGAAALVASVVAGLASFYAGQAVFAGRHLGTTLSAPGVAREVLGTALYVTLVGLFGLALGALVRSTPGGVTGLIGVVVVLPLTARGLPDGWYDDIAPYLPSNAGQDVTRLHQSPHTLGPWTGLGLFAVYVIAAFGAAAIRLTRRDA